MKTIRAVETNEGKEEDGIEGDWWKIVMVRRRLSSQDMFIPGPDLGSIIESYAESSPGQAGPRWPRETIIHNVHHRITSPPPSLTMQISNLNPIQSQRPEI